MSALLPISQHFPQGWHRGATKACTSSGRASQLRSLSLRNPSLWHHTEKKSATTLRGRHCIHLPKAGVPINTLEKIGRNKRIVSASPTRHAESQEPCQKIEESFLEELPNFKNKLNTRQRSGRGDTWEIGKWVNKEDTEVEWRKAQGRFGVTTEKLFFDTSKI